jgi:hypothetical protein
MVSVLKLNLFVVKTHKGNGISMKRLRIEILFNLQSEPFNGLATCNQEFKEDRAREHAR